MPKIATILNQIDDRSISLPVFQRGFVWSRKQVQNLFSSLYQDHPVGSLLVWQTDSKEAGTRGSLEPPAVPLQLLLDGQQRITSLYGVIMGSKPAFFEGNEKAFTNLYFHLEKETFEFYQPIKMRNDPLWIDVTKFFLEGPKPFCNGLKQNNIEALEYMDVFLKLSDIQQRNLYIDKVTGKNKTVDDVVEIFNQVNSGGTKLTSGDLALAKICADWPEARSEMQAKLDMWKTNGFQFGFDWLLRVVNAIVTREAKFVHLSSVSKNIMQEGLQKAELYVNEILNVISSRVGLDHTQVLFAKPAIAVMATILDSTDGSLSSQDWGKLLYWYVNTGMWGRYSGSVETTLDHDLRIVKNANSSDDAIENLIESLKPSRGGNLRITAQNFQGSTRGSRFYSVLYMMTRMGQAQDFYSGLPLKKHLLGKMSQLELHHIFPKSQVKSERYDKRSINALANFCFLTKGTNQKIGNELPTDYFPRVAKNVPSALKSQWIPMETDLWEIQNYEKFLENRRKQLAVAANRFLDDLYSNRLEFQIEKISTTLPPADLLDEEESLINELNEWVASNSLPRGEMDYRLVHSIEGEILTIIDLAWPSGIQTELSEPIALQIREDIDTYKALGQNGYRYFTTVKEFKAHLNDKILLMQPE